MGVHEHGLNGTESALNGTRAYKKRGSRLRLKSKRSDKIKSKLTLVIKRISNIEP